MTDYWVQINFTQVASTDANPASSPLLFLGAPLTLANTIIPSGENALLAFSNIYDPPNQDENYIASESLPYFVPPPGSGSYIIGEFTGDGFSTGTGAEYFNVTQSIGSSFVQGSQPDPTTLVGPTSSPLTADISISPTNTGVATQTISEWEWVLVNTPGTATLFTTGADTVDFNNLTSAQQAAVAAGADTTHGLGGNDNVTLPNSGSATFFTGSTASDTNYQVTGSGGNYTIVEGAGTESIAINGDGSSNITAGSGNDTITINGNGNNTIALGSGNDVVAVTGTGNNTVTDGGTNGVTITQFDGNLDGTDPVSTDSVDITKTSEGNMIIGSQGVATLDASFTGSITFSGTGGILRIDGTTMPTSTIDGFMPGDTIYLAGVPFSIAKQATVFQTSNNSVQPNNVLHVVENGQSYNLQLDPSQSFVGGFQLSADSSGTGTDITYTNNDVTGYSTSVPPYYGVVRISDDIGGSGTGFIVGAHYILTAAHVVSSHLDATSGINYPSTINIYPGTSGVPITVKVTNQTVLSNPSWHTDDINAEGQPSDSPVQSQNDYAVIYTKTNLTKYGIFPFSDFSGTGTVNVTGYPGGQTIQFNDIGSVFADPDPKLSLLDYGPTNPITPIPGYSGGPLWVFNGTNVVAVGMVATTEDAVRFTSSVVSGITDLENDLTHPGSEHPTVTVPSAVKVAAGGSVALGIVVSPADPDDIVSVTISKVPTFETITAGPGETVTNPGSGSYTVTANTPGKSITDLTLDSSFTGTGAPVNHLIVTANNKTDGEETTKSSTQRITVTDPPASATIETNDDPNSTLRLIQAMASFGASGGGFASSSTSHQDLSSQKDFLVAPNHH